MQADDAAAFVAIQQQSYSKAGPVILHSYPKERAMDAPRIAFFLDKKHFAVLATSRPDGRPQAAPIAFTVWRGAFWIASVEGARLRNLRAKPHASIVVMEGEGKEHRAIIAEGPVTIHSANEIQASLTELNSLWIKRHAEAPEWAAAFIEIRPRRIFSYDATLVLP